MKKFCIIVSALIMLFAAGCSKQAQQEPEVSAPEETKRILVSCIGDSITYGAGVSLEKEKYPYMLQKELGKDYEVLNHGISARTMLKDGRDSEYSTVTFSYWDTQAFKKAKECEPAICVIMLGTNDAKPFNWRPDDYKATYIEFVQEFQALPSHPRIIIMIPPAAFEPEKPGKGIDGIADTIANELPPIITQIAEECGTELIDLYSITKDHPELFVDGVHPSAEGNQLIAQTVANKITGVDE